GRARPDQLTVLHAVVEMRIDGHRRLAAALLSDKPHAAVVIAQQGQSATPYVAGGLEGSPPSETPHYTCRQPHRQGSGVLKSLLLNDGSSLGIDKHVVAIAVLAGHQVIAVGIALHAHDFV